MPKAICGDTPPSWLMKDADCFALIAGVAPTISSLFVLQSASKCQRPVALRADNCQLFLALPGESLYYRGMWLTIEVNAERKRCIGAFVHFFLWVHTYKRDFLCQTIRKKYAKQAVHCQWQYVADINQLRKAGLAVVSVKFSLMTDHYITLIKGGRDYVTIAETLKGQWEMPIKQFEKKWRHEAIVIRHNNKIPDKDTRQNSNINPQY